jgi:DNA mismatch endonuclease (patch repair protein)
VDHLTPEARSANMKAVRRQNTEPELRVRRLLHRAGYRYRLHAKGLPGAPDIVFAGRQKVVFVHGCFWHGHECRKGRLPKTRTDYWRARIDRNRARDAAAISALATKGWDTMVVWECEMSDLGMLFGRLHHFLGSAAAHEK